MKYTFTHILRTATLTIIIGLTATTYSQLPYQDPNLTPEQRATDLLQRLTIEENICIRYFLGNGFKICCKDSQKHR